MKPKLFALAGAFACAVTLAPPLKADVQARVDVVAQALAASRHLSLRRISVSGFADADSGRRPPLAQTLEADLRQALGRYGSNWTVLGAGADSSSADALVTGTFERAGDGVDVHVQVVAEPEGTVLWQRNTVLDSVDVSAADLPSGEAAVPSSVDASGAPGSTIPEGPGAGGQTIPTLPGGRGYGYASGDDGSEFGLNVAYKAFFPTNSSFRKAAGSTMNAISFGLSFDDILLADTDFWQENVNNVGTAQSLDYAGTDLAVVAPFHFLDRHLCVYVGPGGRFGQITVNDPALDEGWVGFGNNALDAVAGVKWKADNAGLDLRYSYDLVYSYTGYNTLRLGAFYEF